MLPESEYQSFMQWFEQNYGSQFKGIFGGVGKIPKNTNDITRDRYYQAWVGAGKPGFQQFNPGAPTGDFDAGEYFRRYQTALYYKLQTGEIDQAAYNSNLNAIQSLINTGADISSLPGWSDAKDQWLNTLTVLPDGRNYISPNGKIYNANGVAYDPDSAQILLSQWAKKPEGLTEEQRLAIQKFEYQKQQDVLNRQNDIQSQSDAQVSRMQGLALQQQQGRDQAAMDSQSLQLERDKYLAQLKSQPKSWIEAWNFEHSAPKPKDPWYMNPIGVLAGKDWTQMTPQERGAVNAMDTTINPRTASQLSYYGNERNDALPAGMENTGPMEQGWIPMTPQQAQEIIADINQKAGILAESQMVSQPKTPPAPEWLTNFVPGLQTGQPISKQQTRVASGQLWNQTPWSQRQMLGGYLEYASPKGAPTLTDYEQLVQSMLPKQQDRGARWIPSRQV